MSTIHCGAEGDCAVGCPYRNRTPREGHGVRGHIIPKGDSVNSCKAQPIQDNILSKGRGCIPIPKGHILLEGDVPCCRHAAGGFNSLIKGGASRREQFKSQPCAVANRGGASDGPIEGGDLRAGIYR